MSALDEFRTGLRRSPTEAETRLASEAARQFAPVVADLPRSVEESAHASAHVEVKVNGRAVGEPMNIPLAALSLLGQILDEMARGNIVMLTPIHAELTTQQAADLLQVSRPFLIRLIEGNAIPYRTVGRHRRIRFDDLMRYKQQEDDKRSAVLDELVAQAQELDMGY